MEVESAGVSESVIPTVGFSTLAQGTRHRQCLYSDSDKREMGWKVNSDSDCDVGINSGTH